MKLKIALKYIAVDLAKAGFDTSNMRELCLRKWYNPLKYILGEVYLKKI
jgi:hypothetical protein